MYLHQPEDGIKGQMWRDLGLGDWYFDNIDIATGDAIATRVLDIASNPRAARRKVRVAVDRAQALHAEGARAITSVLTGVAERLP